MPLTNGRWTTGNFEKSQIPIPSCQHNIALGDTNMPAAQLECHLQADRFPANSNAWTAILLTNIAQSQARRPLLTTLYVMSSAFDPWASCAVRTILPAAKHSHVQTMRSGAVPSQCLVVVMLSSEGD